MKNNLARLILMAFDVSAIYLGIFFAYFLTLWIGHHTNFIPYGAVSSYTDKIVIYILIILTLYGLGIYKYRRDFWEETQYVVKSLLLSLLMLLSVLALSKSVEKYSLYVIVISFILMAFIIPAFKFILKKKLCVFGLWCKKASVISNNSDITKIIFGNQYLGYMESRQSESDVVFMDTAGKSVEETEESLSSLVHQKKEIIFIPLLNSFNYSNAGIIEIFNARTNMIVLESSLLKRTNVFIKLIAEIFLSILFLPVFILIFVIVIFMMKKEEPRGSIFFKQERMGKDGEVFVCYKFRSMREDGDVVLEKYLKEHPQEIKNYSVYHKYENDPRITKIGNFLRRTSLDELPQIINVLKCEMSLIGPRPYMLNEREKIGSKIDMVLAVKPGISGLWQVSGRSDVDFHSRVDMDVYYTRNWNLWLDTVILIKTIKTVLVREGAS